MLTRIAILMAALLAGRALAQPAPAAAQVAVDFARAGTEPAWFAGALEELVGAELGRFSQVRVAEKVDPQACPGREARCLVERYRAAGVDVVVLGALRGGRLGYEVHATWSGARAFAGAIGVADASTATLQRRVGDILRPIVQRGGLIEQRPVAAEIATAAPRGGSRATFALVLVGLMVWLAWPALLLVALVGRERLGRKRRPASWKWSALAIAALAGVLLATRGDARVIAALALPVWAERLVPVAAGMLWGAFAWVHVRWAFAPIHGLGQVRHDALWPLLRAWGALSLMRAALLLLYAPVVALTLEACDALAVSSRATWALALPAAGLLACFWVLTVVDNLAVFLDVHLVTGPASERNPWHGTMRRYLGGYLRRLGLEVDSHLLERTLLLPGDLIGTVSYGGGFARPRVLVGDTARTAAFGELPDEREAPERQVNPEEWPIGVIVPGQTDAARLRLAAERRRALADAPPRKRVPKPKLIGEHLTLLGWVLPQPADEGLPLIASTQEEYEIVRGLLQEHYAAFERNVDDDEVDDTDPTQKDFLFGPLIRELGAIARGDCVLATLRHGFALALPHASWPVRQLMRALGFVYQRFLGAPAVIVADAHAALHRGLHHLIQYVDLMRGGSPVLTARATLPRLIATSKEIFDRLARDQDAPPAARDRLLWLSRFFHAPLGARLGRRLAGALAMFVVSAVLAYGAVKAAREYHPIYVERMQKAQEAVDAREE